MSTEKLHAALKAELGKIGFMDPEWCGTDSQIAQIVAGLEVALSAHAADQAEPVTTIRLTKEDHEWLRRLPPDCRIEISVGVAAAKPDPETHAVVPIDQLLKLINDTIDWMKSIRIFINSREKIKQPEGRNLHEEKLDNLCAVRGVLEKALRAAPQPQQQDTQPSALLDETSARAEIGGIGNEIHNLSCRHQNDEVLARELGDIAGRLWGLARIVSSEPASARITREAWQPIETAPLNTSALFYWGGGHYAVGSVEMHGTSAKPEMKFSPEYRDDQAWSVPDFWMSLPDRPLGPPVEGGE